MMDHMLAFVSYALAVMSGIFFVGGVAVLSTNKKR